jgi:hypothetical protein
MMRALLIANLLVPGLLLGGCDTEPAVDDPVTTDLLWFTTCGDPVCSGNAGPLQGVDVCSDEVIGDVCSQDGATCDLGDECNAVMVCAEDDPKEQVGGCPISRKRHKKDIHYLSDADREQLLTHASELRLATWRYRTAEDESRPRLGFIIDDHPESPGVAQDGEHVDVYGLASLALGAVQAQQQQIATQQHELAELRARLSALEAK